MSIIHRKITDRQCYVIVNAEEENRSLNLRSRYEISIGELVKRKMEMGKLVSVIVPVYKTERYLNKCIDGILNQSYKNIEVILVDDGSPDSSPQMCDDYAVLDKRITVIHKKNGGLSSARNAGIKTAKGEYLAFVDSDDKLHNKFIEILYTLCEKNKCQIAQCDFLLVKEDSMELQLQRDEKVNFYSNRELMIKCCTGLEAVKYNVAWNKIYHRNLFENIDYPDGKIHEDEFTTYRLFWNSKKIAVTNLYLYYYLQRGDSITGGKYNLNRLDKLEAYRNRISFLKENQMENEYVSMILRYYRAIWNAYEKVKDNIENPNPILKGLEIEAENIKNVILALPGRSFIQNLYEVYSYLGEEEKKKYVRSYGKPGDNCHQEDYIFPFNRIRKNSKIAIYGAGNVGKAFYKQLNTTGYCDVVLWVDNMWINHAEKPYKVSPLDRLLTYNYDYVVIGLKDSQTAHEIKENLISWGISEEKIIWQNPGTLSLPLSAVKADFMQSIDNIKSEKNRKFILMNTASHGNLGDHAIALASKSLLEKEFPDTRLEEITGKQWECCQKEIRNIIKKEDIIFFAGGGYMGDVWSNEDSRIKQMIKSFPENKKIFLPQTFFYENNISRNEKEFYRKRENVYFIHREKYSFDYFNKELAISDKRNQIFPDMVLSLKRINENHFIRKGIRLCFRTDKERMVHSEVIEKLYRFCQENSVEYRLMDTIVNKMVYPEEREKELDNLLKKISQSKLLITDRLHGMLFAVITGTPCIAFDNMTHKVNGVYQWIQDIPYVTCIDETRLNEKLIEHFYTMDEGNYQSERLENEFIKMTEVIKRWING